MYVINNEKDVTVKGYNYTADTHEYIGPCDCFITRGTGLPAYCTNVAPPVNIDQSMVKVYDPETETWSLIKDFRGTKVWLKSDRTEAVVNYLGEIKKEHTTLEPTSIYDKWVNTKWVTNTGLKLQNEVIEVSSKRDSLIANALQQIQIINFAINAGTATDKEKAKLKELEAYCVELYRIDLSVGLKAVFPDEPK